MASKYHARRCEWRGMKFDSLREMRRYQELDMLQCAGVICNLARQVSFDLTVNGVRVARYVADATYVEMETGRTVVEDVKSGPTRTPVYRLKRALMRACHGIEIEEVE